MERRPAVGRVARMNQPAQVARRVLAVRRPATRRLWPVSPCADQKVHLAPLAGLEEQV